jgi:hypothetical protein
VLLVLKCITTPFLTALVGWAQKRWGQRIAGLLNGFPLLAGPVSMFLAYEQGMSFSMQSAPSVSTGMLGFAFFLVVYAEAAKKYGWFLSAFLGSSSWLGVVALLNFLNPNPQWAFVCGWSAVIIIAVYVRRQPVVLVRGMPSMPYGLIVRAVVTLAILLIATSIAAFVGPKYSGYLSSFPVISLVLYGFTQAHSERATLIEFI